MIVALVAIALAVLSGVLYLKYRLPNPPDRENLEVALDAEMKKWLHRGLSYGLVIGVFKDNKSFIKGYGSVTRESNTTPTSTTIFEIASITKLFTASTLQVLCDKGDLRLDSTLGEQMRHTVLSPAVKEVTLLQLATHRSGFPAFPKEYLRRIPDTDNISRDFTLNDLYAYLANPSEKREPGRFEYSNFGAGLLGHVLALSTGKSYQEVVTGTLLEPLGMTGTFVTSKEAYAYDIAQGYSMNGRPANLLDWSGGALEGAGALKSSAHDMVLFIKANVEDDGSPISTSLKKPHEPQFDGTTAIGWLLPGFLDRLMGNSSVLWHNGLTPGYASYIVIDPQHKTGLVLLSNKSTDLRMPGILLMRLLRTQSWAPSQPSRSP